jgi:tetratricopeptide (TPR) repeat protein
MQFVRPNYHFDSDLREVPNDPLEWTKSVEQLFEILKNESEDKLQIYEHLGIATRILLRLSESESFLLKAVSLSYDNPNHSHLIQNLIRLAHTYQWKKEFSKAHLLFDQVRTLSNQKPISEGLKAAYHQHLAKNYFDQSYYGLAVIEFELALKMRIRIQAPADQIESTKASLKEAQKRWSSSHDKNIIIRRAEVNDAEEVHSAHMLSINEICSKDHTPDEIQAWGGRTYNPANRLPGINEQFYLVAELSGRVEGFCQLKPVFTQQKKTAHIFGFYITPKILNRNVGKTFLQLIEDYCRCNSIEEITLGSSLTAFEFYKKQGFIQNGELEGTKINGVLIRAYPMKKNLI